MVKKLLEKCVLCGSTDLIQFLEMGNIPNSSVFPNSSTHNVDLAALNLNYCNQINSGNKCGNVQLSEILTLDQMYGQDYGYNSSLSNQMIKHLRKIYDEIREFKTLSQGDEILDIGSNDGTLLSFFKGQKLKLTGIDPSGLRFFDNYKEEMSLITDFFPSPKNYFTKNQFSVISSIAMFYDLLKPREFVQEIYRLLKLDGVWVVELSELNMFAKYLSFDQICHEHIVYWDEHRLVRLANEEGLFLAKISYSEINGGSARYIFTKDKNLEINIELREVDFEKLAQINRRLKKVRSQIRENLNLIKESGKSIICYGASTKGNVLGSYLKLSDFGILAVSDTNTYKHGKYFTGAECNIISHEQMRIMKPNYLFVNIWHLRREVISNESDFIKNGGKLIFPLPIYTVVDSNNFELYLDSDIIDETYSLI